jgi:hypothetical protein
MYLRLARRGGTLSASVSLDGTTYRPAGAPVTMSPPPGPDLYAGYAITSADPGRLATNTFRNLTFSSP